VVINCGLIGVNMVWFVEDVNSRSQLIRVPIVNVKNKSPPPIVIQLFPLASAWAIM